MFTKCSASAGRILEILENPDRFFVTENREKRDTGAYIRFENVSFSYLGKKNNIENISFSLKVLGKIERKKSQYGHLLLQYGKCI